MDNISPATTYVVTGQYDNNRDVRKYSNMLEPFETKTSLELARMAGKTPRKTKEDGVQTGVTKATGFAGNADFIAIALKKLHDEVQAEDVPKEFLDILAEIDRKIGSSGEEH